MSTDPVEMANSMSAIVDQADLDARKSSLAFSLGRFSEYWDAEMEKVQQRMEEEYESITEGGVTREDIGSSTDEDST